MTSNLDLDDKDQKKTMIATAVANGWSEEKARDKYREVVEAQNEALDSPMMHSVDENEAGQEVVTFHQKECEFPVEMLEAKNPQQVYAIKQKLD